jgi:DNA-binding transcriptional LysR family regulator
MLRDDLTDLAAFAAVASQRSFRRAAIDLGLSPSALSHAIRGLEERLGVRLLHRTTRSVAPTEAGERLLARLGPALGEIGAAVDSVNQFRERPIGTLRLNVPRSAALLLLKPLMAKYLNANPEMRLEIAIDDVRVDLVERGFDAGIRFGEHLERDMVAVPIGRKPRFSIVASPDYVAAHGRPLTPHDLQQHDCIRLQFPNGVSYRWEFEKDGRALEIEVDGRLALHDQEMTIQAALDGLGIAFTFEEFSVPHIQEGRLVRLLEDWCPPLPGFFLYYPSRRQMPAGLRAFIDLIRSEWPTD